MIASDEKLNEQALERLQRELEEQRRLAEQRLEQAQAPQAQDGIAAVEPTLSQEAAALHRQDGSAVEAEWRISRLERHEAHERIRARELSVDQLSPEARQRLDRELAAVPDQGSRGEILTRTMVKELGLPDEQGQLRPVADVIDGRYNGKFGIDLIGVRDRRPVIIEVKTQELPHLADHPLSTADNCLEMDDTWVRDRWRRALDNPIQREALENAGIEDRFMDREQLNKADAEAWKEILEEKWVVVVHNNGTDVIGGGLLRDAHERHIAEKRIFAIRTAGAI